MSVGRALILAPKNVQMRLVCLTRQKKADAKGSRRYLGKYSSFKVEDVNEFANPQLLAVENLSSDFKPDDGIEI